MTADPQTGREPERDIYREMLEWAGLASPDLASLQQDLAYQRDLIYRMYIRCRFPGEDDLRIEAREWLDANPVQVPPQEWLGVYPGMCVDPECCRGKSHCPRDYSCCE